MTGYIACLVVGLIGGGAIVWLFKSKAQTVAADVKKDLGVSAPPKP